MVTRGSNPDSLADQSTKSRLVLNISRMTVHNGPGIRTLILFKGCPLHCVWCSTPESQSTRPELAVFPDRCIHCNECLEACPSNAVRLSDTTLSIDRGACDACGKCTLVCYSEALRLLGRNMTVDELIHASKKDEVVYRQSGGGVTLSGGEPLLDPEFALELLRALSKHGISAGVDTCGHVPRDTIEKVLPYVSFFLWDIKLMDEDKHKQFTDATNRHAVDNLRMASERGTPVYIRIPVIPGYTDSEDNLVAICEFARGLPSLVEINLLPLHHLGEARYACLDRHYPIAGTPLIPDSTLRQMRSLVESYGLRCSIVG